MSEDEIPSLDGIADKQQTSSTSSSSTNSSTGVEPLPEGAADFVFTALKQFGEDFTLAAFDSDDVSELSEDEIEYFGFEEGTTYSIESIFGYDIERDYVGNPTCSDGNTLDEQPDVATSDIDRHAKVSLGHRLNGYHADRIVNEYGEDAYIRVGIGSEDHEDVTDARSKAKHIRIKITESEATAVERRARAMFNAEEVDFSAADRDQVIEADSFDVLEQEEQEVPADD